MARSAYKSISTSKSSASSSIGSNFIAGRRCASSTSGLGRGCAQRRRRLTHGSYRRLLLRLRAFLQSPAESVLAWPTNSESALAILLIFSMWCTSLLCDPVAVQVRFFVGHVKPPMGGVADLDDEDIHRSVQQAIPHRPLGTVPAPIGICAGLPQLGERFSALVIEVSVAFSRESASSRSSGATESIPVWVRVSRLAPTFPAPKTRPGPTGRAKANLSSGMRTSRLSRMFNRIAHRSALATANAIQLVVQLLLHGLGS